MRRTAQAVSGVRSAGSESVRLANGNISESPISDNVGE